MATDGCTLNTVRFDKSFGALSKDSSRKIKNNGQDEVYEHLKNKHIICVFKRRCIYDEEENTLFIKIKLNGLFLHDPVPLSWIQNESIHSLVECMAKGGVTNTLFC